MSDPHTVVKLGEVAEINPRLAKAMSPDAEVAFVPMSAVNAAAGCIRWPEVRRYKEVRKGYTPFRRGDVLVAKITPCFENGKIALADIAQPLGFGSTEFHVVRPRHGHVESRFLLHYLRSDAVRRTGERRMTGSAGQRRVPADFLANLQVALPPIAEQRRIADVLDRAEALRAKRRLALAKLDSLLGAVFLDLFGDPAVNPARWPTRALGELAIKFSDGPFGSNLKSSHYTESGVRVVRLQNIGVGHFIDDDRAYISPDHFATLRKHECRPGDVLVGTLGDPNLRACIQPAWLTVALNKADCVLVRADSRVSTPEYICWLLNQPSTERMAQGLILGQTRTRISMGRLRELMVPCPPLELQREFSRRVAAVQPLARAEERAATNLDALVTSLQHCAFRGQL